MEVLELEHLGDVRDVRVQVDAAVCEVRALPEPMRLILPTGSTPFYDLLRTKASLLPY